MNGFPTTFPPAIRFAPQAPVFRGRTLFGADEPLPLKPVPGPEGFRKGPATNLLPSWLAGASLIQPIKDQFLLTDNQAQLADELLQASTRATLLKEEADKDGRQASDTGMIQMELTGLRYAVSQFCQNSPTLVKQLTGNYQGHKMTHKDRKHLMSGYAASLEKFPQPLIPILEKLRQGKLLLPEEEAFLGGFLSFYQLAEKGLKNAGQAPDLNSKLAGKFIQELHLPKDFWATECGKPVEAEAPAEPPGPKLFTVDELPWLARLKARKLEKEMIQALTGYSYYSSDFSQAKHELFQLLAKKLPGWNSESRLKLTLPGNGALHHLYGTYDLRNLRLVTAGGGKPSFSGTDMSRILFDESELPFMNLARSSMLPQVLRADGGNAYQGDSPYRPATEIELKRAGFRVENGWVYGYRTENSPAHNEAFLYEKGKTYVDHSFDPAAGKTNGLYMYPNRRTVLFNYGQPWITVAAPLGSVILIRTSDSTNARTHTLTIL